ncbi:PIN domain-containing protein [Rosettibacter firmus]|uniref:PIN domain-containing protein n=1 Tax=Rosettibacter firmus TaxID=3111522 RepID=UPI00336BFA75
MKNDIIHFLIDTDILIEHLYHENKKTNSDLEIAMMNGICFTTVINAAELYFAAHNADEKESIDNLLKALKVLGLNSRYSLNISKFFNKVATVRDALICSVAEFNNLIIFTNNINRYEKTNIKIIQPTKLRE